MLDIKRREFIAVVGGGLLLAAKVNRAQGQPSGKTYRIGFLGVFSHEDYRRLIEALETGAFAGSDTRTAKTSPSIIGGPRADTTACPSLQWSWCS